MREIPDAIIGIIDAISDGVTKASSVNRHQDSALFMMKSLVRDAVDELKGMNHDGSLKSNIQFASVIYLLQKVSAYDEAKVIRVSFRKGSESETLDHPGPDTLGP